MEIEESHPTNVHLSDNFEALNYGDSGGEKNARLSCDEDDLWHSITETPSKPDQSKFTYLFTDDLKALNGLEIKIPSREVHTSNHSFFIHTYTHLLSLTQLNPHTLMGLI